MLQRPDWARFTATHGLLMDHVIVGFASFLPTFAAVLTAIIASATIWGFLRRWYLSGWGSRRQWRGKLNCLVNWATDEYVRDLLGTPVFISQLTTHRSPDSEGPKWVDHIYSTPHAWVVTRSIDNQVQGWSVTISDPKFWWDIKAPTFWQMKGRLGQATFADLVDKPSGVCEERGSRSYLYAESRYFGNPGSYQTYVFMYNDAGTGTVHPSGETIVKKGAFAGEFHGGVVDGPNPATRAGTTVNTLMVLPPNLSIGDREWHEWPIAHHDQIRMLYPETVRNRRRHLSRGYLRRLRRS